MKILPLAMLLLLASAALLRAEVRTVSPSEETTWLHHLIPLPHEMRIPRQVILSRGDVGVTVRPGAKQVYLAAEQVSTSDLTSLAVQKDLHRTLADLKKAGDENIAAIRDWCAGLGPEPWHYRVHDAMNAASATVLDITNLITNTYLY